MPQANAQLLVAGSVTCGLIFVVFLMHSRVHEFKGLQTNPQRPEQRSVPDSDAKFSPSSGSMFADGTIDPAYGLPALCPWSIFLDNKSETLCFMMPNEQNPSVMLALPDMKLNLTNTHSHASVMWCDNSNPSRLMDKRGKTVDTTLAKQQKIVREYLGGTELNLWHVFAVGVDLRQYAIGQSVSNCLLSGRSTSPLYPTRPDGKLNVARIINEEVTRSDYTGYPITPASFTLSDPTECRAAVSYLQKGNACFLKLDIGYGSGQFVLPVKNESFFIPGLTHLQNKAVLFKNRTVHGYNSVESYKLQEGKFTEKRKASLCDSRTKAARAFVQHAEVQEYVYPPLLVHGKKADMRVFLCMTNTYPFEWFYGGAYVRVAGENFDTDNFWHLSQHISTGAKKGTNMSDRYWDFSRFRDYAVASKMVKSKQDFDDRFLGGLVNMLSYVGRAYTKYMDRVKGCFATFGVDVAVTSTMDFAVLEVNKFPHTTPGKYGEYEAGRVSSGHTVQHAMFHAGLRDVRPDTPDSLLWRSVYREADDAAFQNAKVLRVGWKRPPADVSCPDGWRVPSGQDLLHLKDQIGAVANAIDRVRIKSMSKCEDLGVYVTSDVDSSSASTCTLQRWADGLCNADTNKCAVAHRLHVCVRD